MLRSTALLNSHSMCISHKSLLQGSVEGFFHLGIPQAVDEGIQHWVKETVEQGQNFFLLLSLLRVRDHIHQHGYPKEEPYHTKVGGTGGEGLPAALPRLHL